MQYQATRTIDAMSALRLTSIQVELAFNSFQAAFLTNLDHG